jgi:Flp pilus assembly protein TadG
MASAFLHPSRPRRLPTREKGAVAIIVALVLTMLFALGGVVLDLGHLFVNKTELQNAADACALAAAGQLTCDPAGGTCPSSFLQDAEAAGMFVARRNASDFQGSAVAIAAADIRFYTQIGPNSAYLSRAAGANPNSKFVRCIARSAPINSWLMRVRATLAPTAVEAAAVATLAPSQSSCNAAPIGICANGQSPPNYGFSTGSWIVGTFNSGNGNNSEDASVTGSFRWVDFTPNAGGASEVSDQLIGRSAVCGLTVNTTNIREAGVNQGVKKAWNTRFGIYQNGANAETPTSAPPDKTGYAYPSTTIALNQSAYADYRNRQAANTPFDRQSYAIPGAAGNVNGNPLTAAQHLTYGADRRLVAVPLMQCGQSTSVPIQAMGCVLLLNPMSNGASGDIYLEWRGLASDAGSPCRSAGVAGGTNGTLVPTLVQ